MNPTAQPLSFDCQDNDIGFCQVIKQDDLPKYQFPLFCDQELTGGLEELECEEVSVLDNLSDLFTVITNFLVTNDRITPDDSGTHETTAPGYLETDRAYLVNIQVVNQVHGTFRVRVGDSTSTDFTNGVFSAILHSGAGTDLTIIGIDDGLIPMDGYITSVSIQCIRYSALYEIDADTDSYTYAGPTKLCKQAGASLGMSREIPEAVEGLTYRLSFTISDNTCNTPGTEIAYCLGCSGPTFAFQVRNGRIDIDVVCQEDPGKLLTITLPGCFDGCIEDITLYQKNQVRMGVYTKDKEPDEGTITVTETDTRYLATPVGLTEGCKRLGYADACTDYRGQFSGRNIAPEAQSRELINLFPFEGQYGFTIGQTAFIIYHNIIDPGIIYDLSLIGFIKDLDANEFDITANAGGNLLTLTPPPGTPPFVADTPYTFSFTGESGEENNDLVITITAGDTSAEFALIGVDSLVLNVNQTGGQFIPELFSECLNVVENIDECAFIEIAYSNSEPVFGLDFDVPGYEAKIWIPAKLWHPSYQKDRELFESATGHRRVNYSETTRPYTLTTGYLPEYLIQALVLAADCDTFTINGETYVSTTEETSPEWNKSFTLAFVELLFVKQDLRLLKNFA